MLVQGKGAGVSQGSDNGEERANPRTIRETEQAGVID